MEKKTKATDVKKDAALKESFAEIKKAVAETAKAAEKKLAPKKEAVQTEAPKKEAAPKKAPEKKAAPVKKTAAAEKAPEEKVELKAALTLQIDGKDYDPEKILSDCTAAAVKVKKNVKDVKVYVNVNDKAAYFTVDGEGKPEYRINL